LIPDALERVRLAGYEDALVQTLSAGKTALVAGAIAGYPKCLWILDEPFTSLDKQGIVLIETLMAQHCANGGLIVLTSHHDLNLHGVNLQRILLS